MYRRQALLTIFIALSSKLVASMQPASQCSSAMSESQRFTNPSHLESLRETSIEPRILSPYAIIIGRFGYYEPGVVLTVSVISIVSGAILSVIVSIKALVRFYSLILDNCLDFWASSPPANQVVIEAGKLRLEFGCSTQPVPWEFIAEFARSHRDAVDRGFAPLFAKEWWFDNKDRHRLCYAGLRIVPEGGNVTRPNQPVQPVA